MMINIIVYTVRIIKTLDILQREEFVFNPIILLSWSTLLINKAMTLSLMMTLSVEARGTDTLTPKGPVHSCKTGITNYLDLIAFLPWKIIPSYSVIIME